MRFEVGIYTFCHGPQLPAVTRHLSPASILQPPVLVYVLKMPAFGLATLSPSVLLRFGRTLFFIAARVLQEQVIPARAEHYWFFLFAHGASITLPRLSE